MKQKSFGHFGADLLHNIFLLVLTNPTLGPLFVNHEIKILSADITERIGCALSALQHFKHISNDYRVRTSQT